MEAFLVKPYWKCYGKLNVNGEILKIPHINDRCWSKTEAEGRRTKSIESSNGSLFELKEEEITKNRSSGLNLIELLKHASSHLGIGPNDAMISAEKLYLNGYITYWKTDSTSYPKNFDFRAVVASIELHHFNKDIIKYCSTLIDYDSINYPRMGIQSDIHPPISPTISIPSLDNLEYHDTLIYDFIIRNF